MRRARLLMPALVALALVASIGHEARAQRPGPGDRRGDGPREFRPDFPPGPPGGPPHGPPPWEIGPRELERLNLTDAQRTQLEKLRDEELRATIRLDADADLAELDLAQALRADNPDAANVNALVKRVAELRGLGLQAHVTRALGVRRLLTAEQRVKLRSFGPAPHTRAP